MTPILGAFSGLMASELFQKSMSLTLLQVIDTFAWPGFERVTTSDDGAFGSAKGVQDGLCELLWPDIGSERFSIDGDVDAICSFVGGDTNAFAATVLSSGDANCQGS